MTGHFPYNSRYPQALPEYDASETCVDCRDVFDSDDREKVCGVWLCDECALKCRSCGETVTLNPDHECLTCCLRDMPVPTADDIYRLFGMEPL